MSEWSLDIAATYKKWSIGRPILVNPKRLVFYLVFFLVFCLSGAFTILGWWKGFPYRMGLMSALVIPLILLYGIRVTRVVLVYVALTGVVVLSGLYNRSSLAEIILFIRILGFSYLMYRLVELHVRRDNISSIIRLCVAIALLQLPVVVLQRLSYGYLPARVRADISAIDFDFGTFNYKGDASMAFFLTLLVIFLLFDKKRNYVIRHKWPVLVWLTLTVMIANAEAVKLIILLVWGFYFIMHLSPRTIVYSVTVLLVVVGTLASFGVLDEIWSEFTYTLSNNVRVDLREGKQEAFLSGNYARGAAVSYYLSRGILWLGAGPSKYFDVLTKTWTRGNRGHIFTFYSEVGLLGWLLSVLVFFFIAFPGRGWRIRVHWTSILGFLAIQLLSFTTQIMNDISVVLIYCIMSKAYLLEPRGKQQKILRGDNQ